MYKWWITSLLAALPFVANAGGGNESIESFSKAKRLLLSEVYVEPENRKTIYCGADFDDKKAVTLPDGYVTTKYLKRAQRIEWEHVTPAENFGRAFSEWREGHPDCVDSKGRSFKGRKCAEKTNRQYRLMQADLYNLVPAIGANNAVRSNYNFQMLPGEPSSFGSCEMKVSDRKLEPPARARGEIARTYMYMERAYKPVYRMSRQQRNLMIAWDTQYPVTRWECERAERISSLQGNLNTVVAERCL